MTTSVEITQLSKNFGAIKAVADLSFEVRSGEILGFLGPNGAGKSTLINALAGLVRPDSGKLSVMGYDVGSEYRNARRRLGVVPQELIYDPFFQVRETLRFQAGYFGLGHEVELEPACIAPSQPCVWLGCIGHAQRRLGAGGHRR